MLSRKNLVALCAALPLLSHSPAARAESPFFAAPDEGKLLATEGISDVEGSAGGGLATWAVIAGYGTRDSYGANFHYTVLPTQDYRLETEGIAFGIADRLEVSFASQQFSATDRILDRTRIREDVVGIKVRVAGDALYDQDLWVPQIALGMQYKDNEGIGGLGALGVHAATDLGARHNQGIDYYIAATKILLDRSLVVDATLRLTEANQFGLLGFGGPKNDSYQPEFEGSIAYLINRQLAAGIEYRSKPRNLALDAEGDAYDAFVAWFPTRNLSLTLAYVELGTILKPFNNLRQHGPYLSVQVGF